MGEQTPGKARRLYGAARRYLTGQTLRQQRAAWERHTTGRTLASQHFETALHFAGTPQDVALLAQWSQALVALDRVSPTVIICRQPDTALAAVQACRVPVIYAAWFSEVEDFAAGQRLRLALYVDHHANNFQMLRMNSVLHVFTGQSPGDLIRGQVKCYDYAFVRTDEDRDRMRRHLINYDLTARTKIVGNVSVPAWVDACQQVLTESRAAVAADQTGATAHPPAPAQ